MRLLGVDFGFKRIGIAVAEVEHGIIGTRNHIEASGALKKDAVAIAGIARAEEAMEIVVGLPLAENERMARICGQLAGHLRDEGWTVHLVDETLSSFEVERDMGSHGLKASEIKKLKDSESARLILERYIDETARG